MPAVREDLLAHVRRTVAEVLGLDQTGVTHNFFELGGDSILGIQIVARANAAGLSLAPRNLFQYQTIRELAAYAGSVGENRRLSQEPVTGDAPASSSASRVWRGRSTFSSVSRRSPRASICLLLRWRLCGR